MQCNQIVALINTSLPMVSLYKGFGDENAEAGIAYSSEHKEVRPFYILYPASLKYKKRII